MRHPLRLLLPLAALITVSSCKGEESAQPPPPKVQAVPAAMAEFTEGVDTVTASRSTVRHANGGTTRNTWQDGDLVYLESSTGYTNAQTTGSNAAIATGLEDNTNYYIKQVNSADTTDVEFELYTA